ncbi:hypothetical protein [Streptomyces chartreusis]|uniref:hypothetical protein n=1 Tax=Streptomyces chartreusis TaxID=1969 RepID=UPI002E177C85
MALAQYSELFWFPSGELATDVPARVFVHSTNTLATLYADAGGTTPLANPVSTSGTGRLEFWAEEGKYWVHIDSEAFEIAVGAAAQPATQQDILDEEARADAAYAALLHAARHAAAGADPVELSQSQVIGLVSALAALAPLAGATFTGPIIIDGANLTVIDTGTKGYRLRQDGSDLDLEATGTALFLSVWSGPDFDGTQRHYLRLESGVHIAHASGVWQFAAGPFAGAVHTIDGLNNQLGFHGAAPVARATITGSRTDGTALESLLDALAARGDFIDNSTA